MKKILFLFIIIALFVISCTNRPHNALVIQGSQNFVVYHKEDNSNQPDKFGKNEYWVTDASTGWVFYSNQEFTIGDTLVITKFKR